MATYFATLAAYFSSCMGGIVRRTCNEACGVKLIALALPTLTPLLSIRLVLLPCMNLLPYLILPPCLIRLPCLILLTCLVLLLCLALTLHLVPIPCLIIFLCLVHILILILKTCLIFTPRLIILQFLVLMSCMALILHLTMVQVIIFLALLPCAALSTLAGQMHMFMMKRYAGISQKMTQFREGLCIVVDRNDVRRAMIRVQRIPGSGHLAIKPWSSVFQPQIRKDLKS